MKRDSRRDAKARPSRSPRKRSKSRSPSRKRGALTLEELERFRTGSGLSTPDRFCAYLQSRGVTPKTTSTSYGASKRSWLIPLTLARGRIIPIHLTCGYGGFHSIQLQPVNGVTPISISECNASKRTAIFSVKMTYTKMHSGCSPEAYRARICKEVHDTRLMQMRP